jgi:hypothetical protein
MFVKILNDWRRALFLKEERFSLSEGFMGAPSQRRVWSSFFYEDR